MASRLQERVRQQRYEEAMSGNQISARRGTPYPCSQEDIDATKYFSCHNERPPVSASRATRELIEHNDRRRRPSTHERDAIERLVSALEHAIRGRWGPDLIFKCFFDLDVIFFGGVLRGNVRLGWGDGNEWDKLEDEAQEAYLGLTTDAGSGRADLFLSARGILMNPLHDSSLRTMFATTLHEMCHVYEVVRVKPDELPRPGEGHGLEFGSRIHAVDKRVKDLLGLDAVEAWENYRRCHTGGRTMERGGRRGFVV